VVQSLVMLISMVVVFFASHPLGHLFVARAYGVGNRVLLRREERLSQAQSEMASVVGGLVRRRLGRS